MCTSRVGKNHPYCCTSVECCKCCRRNADWKLAEESKGLNAGNGCCCLWNWGLKSCVRINWMSEDEFIRIIALYRGPFFKIFKGHHVIWYKMNYGYQIHNGCLCYVDARKKRRSGRLKCVKWRFTLCSVRNCRPKSAERINEMSRNEFIRITVWGTLFQIFQKTPCYLIQIELCISDWQWSLLYEMTTCHVVVENGVFTVTYCICWIWLTADALSAVSVIEENHWTFIWSVSFCEKTCFQCLKMARKHMRNMRALRRHGHVCRHHSSISVYLGVHEMMCLG